MFGSRRIAPKSIEILFAELLVLLLCGCGGSNSSTGPGSHPDIAFVSSRALDGSDGPNTTCQFTTNTGTGFLTSSNLWVVDANGSSAAPLTHVIACPMYINRRAWSPDGAKIAFDPSTNSDTGGNVWVVNADGTSAIPLTHYPVPPHLRAARPGHQMAANSYSCRPAPWTVLIL